jgi:hypothetical protein
MVQAMINIDERSNRVLNIVKAKYGFKDKSQTIDFVMSNYEENFLEPELRPEFVKRIREIEKNDTFKKYSSLSELRKEIENA